MDSLYHCYYGHVSMAVYEAKQGGGEGGGGVGQKDGVCDLCSWPPLVSVGVAPREGSPPSPPTPTPSSQKPTPHLV